MLVGIRAGDAAYAKWQVTLCDLIWHAGFRSGVVLVLNASFIFYLFYYAPDSSNCFRICCRLKLMSRDTQQQRKNRTLEGITDMSYTIESIEQRAFYTRIFANLNGRPIRRHSLFAIAYVRPK